MVTQRRHCAAQQPRAEAPGIAPIPALHIIKSGPALANRGASQVASSETLGALMVHSGDMGDTLFQGHRLHSRGVLDLPPAQTHSTHDILDSARLQLIAANLVEAEVQII